MDSRMVIHINFKSTIPNVELKCIMDNLNKLISDKVINSYNIEIVCDTWNAVDAFNDRQTME